MITMKQPSVVLNSIDEGMATRFNMKFTHDIKFETMCHQSVINLVKSDYALINQPIENLIINAHGISDEDTGHGFAFDLGARFTIRHNHFFSQLKGKVKKIWFSSCCLLVGSGEHWISDIARRANCYVIASYDEQISQQDWFHTTYTYPFGQMDGFEGRVVSFNGNGHISWRHQYSGER